MAGEAQGDANVLEEYMGDGLIIGIIITIVIIIAIIIIIITSVGIGVSDRIDERRILLDQSFIDRMGW